MKNLVVSLPMGNEMLQYDDFETYEVKLSQTMILIDA